MIEISVHLSDEIQRYECKISEIISIAEISFLLLFSHQLSYSLLFFNSQFGLDGAPLCAGLACLLKQVHPVTTEVLLSYLGQFVRTTIEQALKTGKFIF